MISHGLLDTNQNGADQVLVARLAWLYTAGSGLKLRTSPAVTITFEKVQDLRIR
jgi:hypothetical protein